MCKCCGRLNKLILQTLYLIPVSLKGFENYGYIGSSLKGVRKR